MEMNKDNLKKDLCYTSSGTILNRNMTSTGFWVDSALLQNDSVDEIAELFLLNSMIDKNNPESIYAINKYLKYPFTEITALSGNIMYSGLKKIKLEKNYRLDMTLDEVMKRRKSSRKYTGDNVAANHLSTILRASNGVTHYITDGNSIRQQRTCPSGGGLYPVKLYVYVNKIRNLKKGVYVYDPIQDCLYLIQDDSNNLTRFLDLESNNELPNIKETAFILFFIIEQWKSVSKYGSSGLKFAYLEVGEMAQNGHLAAACLGLGSCAYASFSSDLVKDLLKIDGHYENFQHAILFGISAEK
jgi:SagB-type dehydrogenase family enzyme